MTVRSSGDSKEKRCIRFFLLLAIPPAVGCFGLFVYLLPTAFGVPITDFLLWTGASCLSFFVEWAALWLLFHIFSFAASNEKVLARSLSAGVIVWLFVLTLYAIPPLAEENCNELRCSSVAGSVHTIAISPAVLPLMIVSIFNDELHREKKRQPSAMVKRLVREPSGVLGIYPGFTSGEVLILACTSENGYSGDDMLLEIDSRGIKDSWVEKIPLGANDTSMVKVLSSSRILTFGMRGFAFLTPRGRSSFVPPPRDWGDSRDLPFVSFVPHGEVVAHAATNGALLFTKKKGLPVIIAYNDDLSLDASRSLSNETIGRLDPELASTQNIRWFSRGMSPDGSWSVVWGRGDGRTSCPLVFNADGTLHGVSRAGPCHNNSRNSALLSADVMLRAAGGISGTLDVINLFHGHSSRRPFKSLVSDIFVLSDGSVLAWRAEEYLPARFDADYRLDEQFERNVANSFADIHLPQRHTWVRRVVFETGDGIIFALAGMAPSFLEGESGELLAPLVKFRKNGDLDTSFNPAFLVALRKAFSAR